MTQLSMTARDRLRQGAATWGIVLDDEAVERFSLFYDLLIEWNQRFNLTRITSESEVVDKHFLDSLSAWKVLRDRTVPTPRLIDLGTGPGFPGLPLSIAFPDWEVVLVETIGKKVSFLLAVIDALGLKNTRAIQARSEDLARDPKHRESYDVVTARALAALPVLSELSLPFAKIGGGFLAMKGPDSENELVEAYRALSILGAGKERVFSFTLLDTDMQRTLLWIPKEKSTPKSYPRQAGTPQKKPL